RADQVAAAARAVAPSDRVYAESAGEAAIHPDAALRSLMVFELRVHAADKLAHVLRRMRAINPWKPLAETVAIALDSGEDGFGIECLEHAYFDVGGYGAAEHDVIVNEWPSCPHARSTRSPGPLRPAAL